MAKRSAAEVGLMAGAALVQFCLLASHKVDTTQPLQPGRAVSFWSHCRWQSAGARDGQQNPIKHGSRVIGATKQHDFGISNEWYSAV